jgi:hypothetical protein
MNRVTSQRLSKARQRITKRRERMVMAQIIARLEEIFGPNDLEYTPETKQNVVSLFPGPPRKGMH